MNEKLIFNYLKLLKTPNIGKKTAKKIWEKINNINLLFDNDFEFAQNIGLNLEQFKFLQSDKHNDFIKSEIEKAKILNIKIICLEEESYPRLLREIDDPPPILMIRGDEKILKKPQIAIVGTRYPTEYGILNSHEFAKKLVTSGFVITSGLAQGVDSFAHQGCLNANGKTIAVLGTGVDIIYPHRNIKLSEDIVNSGGALISEYALGTGPCAHNFPPRNRIISGLSYGVLITEAAEKSGSLITARLALEQNREIFSIPGLISNQKASGCHKLLKLGAKLVENEQDILQEIGISPQNNSKSVEPVAAKVLEFIGYKTASFDYIIAMTGLPITKLGSILTKLELEGLCKPVPGGYIRI